eukprot:7378422-Heterocapsa_arctica.AAC.1
MLRPSPQYFLAPRFLLLLSKALFALQTSDPYSPSFSEPSSRIDSNPGHAQPFFFGVVHGAPCRLVPACEP